MTPLIYLDNNSTTPVDPEVLEAMLPYFTTKFGNASNTTHEAGAAAAEAVATARAELADFIGAAPREIIFTSGATESNSLAILGACRSNKYRFNHVVTTAIEHKAVLGPCRQLEQEGFRVTYLPVDRHGSVSLDQLASAITPETALVSVMAANNEIGTLAPLSDIAALCIERKVLLHTDAVQALGRVPLNVDKCPVDMLSISAHKMYGPKGVGALYVRRKSKVELTPLTFGGGQEHGIRSGTLPVPLIVGLGAAARIAKQSLREEAVRMARLRDLLQRELLAAFPNAIVHGHPHDRLPGLLSIGFPDLDGDVLIQVLAGVAASQGSACSDGSFEPSHVLRAIGLSDTLATATLRLGVGRFNTDAEIMQAAELVSLAVDRAVATRRRASSMTTSPGSAATNSPDCSTGNNATD